MAECKLVLFDCDGTLMDSENIAAEVETELMKEYGIEMDVPTFNLRFAGTSSHHVQNVMEEESGRHFPDDHQQNLENRMNEKLWREVKTVAGAHDMLDNLDQPRAICSNAGMSKLKLELTRGELWDRFRPYIYSAKDMEEITPKPAPDLYLHAAKEFETEPQHCVVVEDSTTGVQAGVAAGMRVIGFVGGKHTHQGHADELTEAGAETVISRLTDIPAILEAFAQWDGF